MISDAKDKSNIIFFDGVCNLCNFWVKYVFRNDPDGVFYFSSLQSEFASNFLTQNNINSDFETIIFFTEGRFLKESDAVVSILFKIGGFNRLLSRIIKPLPIKFRDGLYKFVSRNRYRIFGKKEYCVIPDQNVKKRFL
jgi:predicted DCC family thiol-disulfide oxidoreductase YuxK